MSAGTTVTCTGCGVENPDVARFCMRCGTSLEISCASCGTALPAAARFCFACGHEIEAGATAGEAGQSAQQVTDSIAAQLQAITSGAGERRTITMMFCDVKDSSATAEGLDPEAWSDIMHATMHAFVAPVERYGGTVARLLGDAILAYFGAPVAHEDDPQRALLAALAILEGTRELAERVRREHGTEFDVRIGINTGLVVVGELGSDTFGEYAALGDAANVAARMEQTAAPGTIRITEATHRLIAPLFDTEPVGTVEVRGRTDPIAAYTVLGARGTPGQLRGVEGLTAPLVARDAELAALHDAVAAVRGGTGRIVSLIGEAGLGKSRLVAELRRDVGEDVRWLTGACHSYEDTTPYAPFVGALSVALGLGALPADADPTTHVLARMVELVGPAGREQGVHLCAALGLPLEDDDAHGLTFADPGTNRARTFDAAAALLTALAAQGPVVLELEDLHWADPTSIELTEHLLPLVESSALLVLLLLRPRRDEAAWTVHERAAREHPHRYTPLTLAPLDEAGARELVAHLLRVEGLGPTARDTILAKAEGNPFFVEEVVRSLLDDGTIVRDGDRFVTTRDLDDLRVPDTLAAVLTTRLDRLEPHVRTVVHTAAVLGREFQRDMLAELTDPAVDLDHVLSDLQRREILVERRHDAEVVLAFRHELTRDAAYGTLLQSVRRDLHRLVGKLVEERHPDRVFDLAWHFAEGDEPRTALPYLVAAGERAFGAFARDDAVRYFRRAIALWEATHELALVLRAYEGLGNALMFLGDMPGSIETFARMRTFAREESDLTGELSALNKGGLATLMTGDVDAAEALMQEARALATRNDHRAGLGEFHIGYCYLNVSQGRLDEAERALGEAAEVCLTLDRHARNFGLTHFAGALTYQARFPDARAAIARAREQAEIDEDYEHLTDLDFADATIEFFTGRPVRSAEISRAGLEMAERYGIHMGRALLAWIAGAAAVQLGDLEAARSYLDVAIEAGTMSGLTGPSASSAALHGTIDQFVHGGRVASAKERFAEARELSLSPMSRASGANIFGTLGVGLIAAGDLDAADEALDTARDVPSAFSKLMEPELPLCRGAIALLRGDLDGAERHFDAAVEAVERTGLELFAARAAGGTAALALARGRVEDAVRRFHEAETIALKRALHYDAIGLQRTAATMLADAGAHEEARGFRERWSDGIADVAARMTDADLRRAFLRTNALVS